MNEKIASLLLRKHNHIYVYDEINQESFKNFSMQSRYLRLYKQPESVNIYISSPGGEVDYAMAIVDEISGLKEAGIKVNTIGIGQVYSAGIYILCAGDKRYGTENTSYMIHPFRYSIDEEYHAHAREYVKYAEQLYSEIMVWVATRCGQTKIKPFIERINDSVYLNNDTAKKLGLIHAEWDYKQEINLQPGDGNSGE